MSVYSELMNEETSPIEKLKYLSETEQVIGRPPGTEGEGVETHGRNPRTRGVRPAPQPSIRGKRPPREQARAISTLLKGKEGTEYEGPSLSEKVKYLSEIREEKARTGGSYSTAEQAFKTKIQQLMKQKRPRPGVAATKAGRRQQSREEGGSGYEPPKTPHATKF